MEQEEENQEEEKQSVEAPIEPKTWETYTGSIKVFKAQLDKAFPYT